MSQSGPETREHTLPPALDSWEDTVEPPAFLLKTYIRHEREGKGWENERERMRVGKNDMEMWWECERKGERDWEREGAVQERETSEVVYHSGSYNNKVKASRWPLSLCHPAAVFSHNAQPFDQRTYTGYRLARMPLLQVIQDKHTHIHPHRHAQTQMKVLWTC